MAFQKDNVSFAVQSGGHSSINGASNIGDGVTLDLSSLSSLALSPDKGVLEVGAGARWQDIYEFIEQENLSVNGVRAGSVRVGGFLLGGGISVSGRKYGWACDSIRSIEYVTGNGSIIEANPATHSRLFMALKGSGSVLRVATKFRLQTYSLSELEVDFIAYEWEYLMSVIRSIAEFNAKAGFDKDASADLSVSFDTVTNQTVLVLMLSRTGDIHLSPLLHRFFDIPNLHHSVQKVTHAELALDIYMNNPAGFRQHKSTLTISNSASLVVDVISLFARLTAEPKYAQDPAYRPGLLVQPLTLSHLHQSKESGNSTMLGLEQSPDPLIRKCFPLSTRHGKSTGTGPPTLIILTNLYKVISLEVRWSIRTLDSTYKALIENLLELYDDKVREKKLLHDFKYINYASAEQDVFRVLQQSGQLEELRTLRDEYDPDHFFANYLSRPFDLSSH